MTMTATQYCPPSLATHKALIIGQGTLASALAEVLQSKGIPFEVCETLASAEQASGFTLVFNLWFPDPTQDQPQTLSDYPRQLLEHGLMCGEKLSETHSNPAIINFAFLPAIYVGTELEHYVPALRGGITGVTRTLARRFGKQSVRVTCVQAGLVDMPEVQAWVSDTVKSVQVPTKRWATPSEVAKFMAFLAIDSLYTTGQTMIIDGGLTAGITGT